MRALRFGLGIGLSAALLLAPTSASAGEVTTINIHVEFGPPQVETFTTTGSILCPKGSAVTDPIRFDGGGRQGRGVFTFHLVKTLTCEDGSGTFQIRVDAAGTPTSGGTIGGFSLTGGTGAYEGLNGGGSLVGTFFDGGIDDSYTGRLSVG